jgi:hypothetical protein
MLYLFRVDERLVSHCRCRSAPIALPRQAECPWCGCGWLFTCLNCGKAFTFAIAKQTRVTLEEYAQRDLGKDVSSSELVAWTRYMRQLLRDIGVDRTYVYFDGRVVDASASEVTFRGIYARHSLGCVPQTEALRDKSVVSDLLRNPDYWNHYRIAERPAGRTR